MDDQNPPVLQDDETGFTQDLKKQEKVMIDAGYVVMMMAVEGKGVVPVPVTAVFTQLFGIINHLDARCRVLEEKMKIDPNAGESSIITLN